MPSLNEQVFLFCPQVCWNRNEYVIVIGLISIFISYDLHTLFSHLPVEENAVCLFLQIYKQKPEHIIHLFLLFSSQRTRKRVKFIPKVVFFLRDFCN